MSAKPSRFLILTGAIAGAAFLHGCSSPDRSGTLGYIGVEPLPVHDVSFFSNSLQRRMHINVILPRGYASGNTSYPVLYLCHGFTSNYHEFVHLGVPEYLNGMDMIAVMVDVGNSGYVNWAESSDGLPLKFRDHVLVDVVSYVDSHYRTIADRKGRAINGISMGAAGAISMGLAHPEMFCSIAGHSGGYGYERQRNELRDPTPVESRRSFYTEIVKDTTMRYRDIDIAGFSTMSERTPKGRMFVKEEDIDSVDPYLLALRTPKEELPHIYIDCGTKDFLYQSTRKFMDFLLDHQIPFVYAQSEGTHEEDYWGREVAVSMAVQYAVMLRNIWGRKFEVYNPYPKLDLGESN
jgi:S-formylglutathione hydrolase FrmB